MCVPEVGGIQNCRASTRHPTRSRVTWVTRAVKSEMSRLQATSAEASRSCLKAV